MDLRVAKVAVQKRQAEQVKRRSRGKGEEECKVGSVVRDGSRWGRNGEMERGWEY